MESIKDGSEELQEDWGGRNEGLGGKAGVELTVNLVTVFHEDHFSRSTK